MYILETIRDKYYLYKVTEEGFLHICNNNHMRNMSNIWKWSDIERACRTESTMHTHEWKCLTREEAMVEVL
jgi:hypothetical protein